MTKNKYIPAIILLAVISAALAVALVCVLVQPEQSCNCMQAKQVTVVYAVQVEGGYIISGADNVQKELTRYWLPEQTLLDEDTKEKLANNEVFDCLLILSGTAKRLSKTYPAIFSLMPSSTDT